MKGYFYDGDVVPLVRAQARQAPAWHGPNGPSFKTKTGRIPGPEYDGSILRYVTTGKAILHPRQTAVSFALITAQKLRNDKSRLSTAKAVAAIKAALR